MASPSGSSRRVIHCVVVSSSISSLIGGSSSIGEGEAPAEPRIVPATSIPVEVLAAAAGMISFGGVSDTDGVDDSMLAHHPVDYQNGNAENDRPDRGDAKECSPLSRRRLGRDHQQKQRRSPQVVSSGSQAINDRMCATGSASALAGAWGTARSLEKTLAEPVARASISIPRLIPAKQPQCGHGRRPRKNDSDSERAVVGSGCPV